MVVYRTDHLYVGKGAHHTLIPGRVLVVKFEVLADESEFDLAAIYMPCRGTTGAGAVWERLADWVTARRGLIMAGDMNASLATADERRTPSDRALRELVEEGDVVQVGGGETTYGRADTELDYWLTSPDMVTRWVGCGTVEGVSDHRAVEGGKKGGEENAGGSNSGGAAGGIEHQDRLGDRDERTAREGRRGTGGAGEAEGDNEDVAGNGAREEESEPVDGM